MQIGISLALTRGGGRHGAAAPVDTTAPTLSSPTGTQTGATTASLSVTSDEANGVLYYSVLAAASAAPTAAAFLAGTTGGVATGSTSSPLASANSFSATGLTASTAYKAHYFQRDAAGNNSTVSSSASFTTAAAGDTTAPTLSSPTDTASGSTGGTLSVTTDEGNGTLYWFVSTSATPPTATALKAGTGAASFGNQAVTGTGVQNATASGLTASTAYFTYFLHRDAAGNDSSISPADGFTTDASGPSLVAFPSNREVVSYGDSQTENGQNGELRTTNGYRGILSNYGTPSYLVSKTGGRLRPGKFGGFGISGGTAIQGAASPRLNASNSASVGHWWRGTDNGLSNPATSGSDNKGIADANSHSAGIILLNLGTNDGGTGANGYSSSSNWDTGGASRTAIDTLLNGFSSSKLVIVTTPFPRGRRSNDTDLPSGGGAPLGSTAATRYLAFMDFIKKYHYASGDALAKSNVIVLDMKTRWLSSDSAAAALAKNKPGVLQDDALHLSPYGAKDLAAAVDDALTTAYGSTYTGLSSMVTLPTSGTTGFTNAAACLPYLNSNPAFVAGTAGATGSNTFASFTGPAGATPVANHICQGWTIGGTGTQSGLTVIVSKGSDSDGDYQRIQVSGTLVNAGTAGISFTQNISSANLLTLDNALGGSGTLGTGSLLTDALRQVLRYKLATGSQCVRDINVGATWFVTATTQATGAGVGGGLGANSGTGVGTFLCDPSSAGDAGGTEVQLFESDQYAVKMPQMATGYDAASPGQPTAVSSCTVAGAISFHNVSGSTASVSLDLKLYGCGIVRTGSTFT